MQDKDVHVSFDGAELDSIKIKMQELQNLLDANAKKPFMNSQEVLDTRVQLEKLNKQYNKLTQNQEEAGRTGNVAFNNMQKGIEKATSRIKRFGLSLLGIRSIYSLVSKASSAYLSQDTELANKLQAVWVGLGAMLEPIISAIANTLLKAVKYINVFIKALTGVDLLAKATAKSIGGTNKSAKALSKTLAGFDELNNLDTTSDASGGSGFSLGDAFGDVKLDEEVTKKIEDMAGVIKKNQDLIKGFFATLGITLGAIKIVEFVLKVKELGTMLSPIGGFITKFGKPIAGATAIIAGIGLAIYGIINYLKEPTWLNFITILVGIGVAAGGVALIFKGIPALIVAIVGIVVALGLAIYKNWNTIKETLSKVGIWIKDNVITPVANFFSNLWAKIKEGVSNAVQVVKDKFNTVKTFLSNIVTNIVSLFRNIGTKVGDAIGSAFKIVINGVLKAIENILNFPIKSINKLIDVINAVPGINMSKLSTFNLPRLATGTNYVPEDQLAYIHKGEAVVPKKFNSDEYFGRGNEETNELLQTLIEKVENIEINPYTTIKDVGASAVNYINGQKRQLGRSVIA